MLTARSAFRQSVQSAPILPLPEDLQALWEWGIKPRRGQLIMVAGRSGSQKSGFVLYWTRKMGLPTLYMSGDMSPFEATSRLVEMDTGHTEEEIEQWWDDPIYGAQYQDILADMNIRFSFGQPITWASIEAEMQAWVELHNEFPPVLVIDNLMDIEGCEDEDNATQRMAMQTLAGLARETGSTIIVIHHATDKSEKADLTPGKPPSRREIKNGVSEKPQLMLTVALEPESLEFRVACVKQRSGKSDPSASDYIRLRAYPEQTRFGPLHRLTPHWENPT